MEVLCVPNKLGCKRSMGWPIRKSANSHRGQCLRESFGKLDNIRTTKRRLVGKVRYRGLKISLLNIFNVQQERKCNISFTAVH